MHRRSERNTYEKLIYDQHITRIKNAKPVINVKPPKPHPLNNKYIMEHQRNNKNIEKQNSILLEQIAKRIQQTHIDNIQHPSVMKHSKFKKQISSVRKRLTLAKITDENIQLLNRIQTVEPNYDHAKYELDEENRRKKLKSMSLYPEYYT